MLLGWTRIWRLGVGCVERGVTDCDEGALEPFGDVYRYGCSTGDNGSRAARPGACGTGYETGRSAKARRSYWPAA
jgi:hypothetical protein